MPRLSDSMEEGVVVSWLAAEGERIALGQPLVEVETDKATVVYDADVDGVLLRIVVPEGAAAPIGAPIALVGEAGETTETAADHESVGAASALSSSTGAAPPAVPRAEARAAARPRVSASPVARRMAAEHGLDLAGLAGSGPRGRVVMVDVLRATGAVSAGGGRPSNGHAERPPRAFAEVAAPPPEPASQAPPAPDEPPALDSAKGETRSQETTRLQRTVARRMSESRATVPAFELRAEVDMSGCVELRTRLKEIADPAPTYNDMIVKAAALALRKHPRVNGSYRDGRFESYSRVNVGFAVATDDALVVPTVFDADRRSLGAIARVTRELAGRVREQTVTPPELGGGTFSVSNLGMLGVDSFSAIVNPPQAAILAVGALAKRPAVDADGRVVARETVTLTLTCDHRILYGADGARFLADLRTFLERPLALSL